MPNHRVNVSPCETAHSLRQTDLETSALSSPPQTA